MHTDITKIIKNSDRHPFIISLISEFYKKCMMLNIEDHRSVNGKMIGCTHPNGDACSSCDLVVEILELHFPELQDVTSMLTLPLSKTIEARFTDLIKIENRSRLFKELKELYAEQKLKQQFESIRITTNQNYYKLRDSWACRTLWSLDEALLLSMYFAPDTFQQLTSECYFTYENLSSTNKLLFDRILGKELQMFLGRRNILLRAVDSGDLLTNDTPESYIKFFQKIKMPFDENLQVAIIPQNPITTNQQITAHSQPESNSKKMTSHESKRSNTNDMLLYCTADFIAKTDTKRYLSKNKFSINLFNDITKEHIIDGQMPYGLNQQSTFWEKIDNGKKILLERQIEAEVKAKKNTEI